MSSEIRDEIVREIDRMPEQLQVRVLNYVQGLKTDSPVGVEASRLLEFCGRISEEDGALMLQAIEEGCEQVNEDAW